MSDVRSSTKIRWVVKLFAKGVHLIQAKFPQLYEKISVFESKKWHQADIPWSPLVQPLENCNVALITSGGIILKGQEPFDLNDHKGDCSFREIPHDASLDHIVISHMMYDVQDVQADTEVMFPLNILKKLAAEGMIGKVNDRHYSFSGGIGDPVPLIEKTAPEVAARLARDRVDLAILTPA